MTLLGTVVSTLLFTAGVAAVAVIVTLAIHDVLRRWHRDAFTLDTAFAHVFGVVPADERAKHGVLGVFVAGWACVLAFVIVRELPSVQVAVGAGTLLFAVLFALALYLVLMLVFLPIYRLGAFGRRHHVRVPYWGAFYVALFVALVAALIALVT